MHSISNKNHIKAKQNLPNPRRFFLRHDTRHENPTQYHLYDTELPSHRSFGRDKPEKKEKYFQIAESEADHLLTLTNKVLTISKLEQHKLKMHKEELELEPVIDKLIDKFTAKAEKPVHFIKDLQAEVIYADEEFFGEVLSNLIDNAIKYSKESVEITISSTGNELYTILKVHDNGLGISDDDQKVIFNKYERASAGRQRKKGSSGFGLGLNFVQQVVEAHEGKIIVNSIEGEFTEFVIYLPQIIQKL